MKETASLRRCINSDLQTLSHFVFEQHRSTESGAEQITGAGRIDYL